MIRLVMQALQEPERICAASERDITPTIRDGSPANTKRRCTSFKNMRRIASLSSEFSSQDATGVFKIERASTSRLDP